MGSGTPRSGTGSQVRPRTVGDGVGIQLGCPDSGAITIESKGSVAFVGQDGSLRGGRTRVSVVVGDRVIGQLADSPETRRLNRCLEAGTDYIGTVNEDRGAVVFIYERD